MKTSKIYAIKRSSQPTLDNAVICEYTLNVVCSSVLPKTLQDKHVTARQDIVDKLHAPRITSRVLP